MKKKAKPVEAMTVEAFAYYCPHFDKMVHNCTCHERPVFKILTPAQAAELRELRRVYRAAKAFERAEPRTAPVRFAALSRALSRAKKGRGK